MSLKTLNRLRRAGVTRWATMCNIMKFQKNMFEGDPAFRIYRIAHGWYNRAHLEIRCTKTGRFLSLINP